MNIVVKEAEFRGVDDLLLDPLYQAVGAYLERLIKWAKMSFKSAKSSSQAIQKFIKELETWISRVDKMGLPGKFKSWIY